MTNLLTNSQPSNWTSLKAYNQQNKKVQSRNSILTNYMHHKTSINEFRANYRIGQLSNLQMTRN